MCFWLRGILVGVIIFGVIVFIYARLAKESFYVVELLMLKKFIGFKIRLFLLEEFLL